MLTLKQIDDLPLPAGIPPTSTNHRFFRIVAALKNGEIQLDDLPEPYRSGDSAVSIRFFAGLPYHRDPKD